jgi:prepilin signal peptidase PulO-like enzyme (type II secretory pathway)
VVTALFAFAAAQFFLLNRPLTPGGPWQMPWILMVVQMLLVLDLICLSVVDYESFLIPIETTIYMIPVGLALGIAFPELHLDPTPWTGIARLDAAIDSFNGIVIGGGLLWAIGFLCVLLIKKEGMGAGDAHLLAMVGAMLGWKAALYTFLLGILLGVIAGLAGILWSNHQRKKLGSAYKARKPRYELPEAEEDQGPPPAGPLLVYGLVVVPVEIALFVVYFQNAMTLGYEATLVSAAVCLTLGLGLLLAYPVQKGLISTKKWPMGQIEERADGKKEEVLEGNYMPFGPPLAVAGLLVAFYYPLFSALAYYNFTRVWPAYPFHMLGIN